MEAHVIFNWFWFNYQHNAYQIYIFISISIEQKILNNYILVYIFGIYYQTFISVLHSLKRPKSLHPVM
jgi:hypothetical protein